jgi:hypothetical protein
MNTRGDTPQRGTIGGHTQAAAAQHGQQDTTDGAQR